MWIELQSCCFANFFKQISDSLGRLGLGGFFFILNSKFLNFENFDLLPVQLYLVLEQAGQRSCEVTSARLWVLLCYYGQGETFPLIPVSAAAPLGVL